MGGVGWRRARPPRTHCPHCVSPLDPSTSLPAPARPGSRGSRSPAAGPPSGPGSAPAAPGSARAPLPLRAHRPRVGNGGTPMGGHNPTTGTGTGPCLTIDVDEAGHEAQPLGRLAAQPLARQWGQRAALRPRPPTPSPPAPFSPPAPAAAWRWMPAPPTAPAAPVGTTGTVTGLGVPPVCPSRVPPPRTFSPGKMTRFLPSMARNLCTKYSRKQALRGQRGTALSTPVPKPQSPQTPCSHVLMSPDPMSPSLMFPSRMTPRPNVSRALMFPDPTSPRSPVPSPYVPKPNVPRPHVPKPSVLIPHAPEP